MFFQKPTPIILFIISILLFSCGASKPAISNSQFSDDLSVYRIKVLTPINLTESLSTIKIAKPKKVFVVPKVAINTEINEKIDLIAEKNNSKLSRYSFKIQGYRVQVFSGGNRAAAEKIQLALKDMFNGVEDENGENDDEIKTNVVENENVYKEDIEVKLEYDQPNYKVKVGKYLSKIEAHKMRISLKDAYPLSIVIPEKIKLSLKDLR